MAMVLSEGNMSLKNPLTPPGIDPGTVRLVAYRLNHYATPGPHFLNNCMEIIQLSSKTGVAIAGLAQIACEKEDLDRLHAHEADHDRRLKMFPKKRTSVTN